MAKRRAFSGSSLSRTCNKVFKHAYNVLNMVFNVTEKSSLVVYCSSCPAAFTAGVCVSALMQEWTVQLNIGD